MRFFTILFAEIGRIGGELRQKAEREEKHESI